jgi:hypothetical protein
MPVILATQEAEIRRIMARSQLGQMVLQTLSQNNPPQNSGVAQGVCSEYCKNKQTNKHCFPEQHKKHGKRKTLQEVGPSKNTDSYLLAA